MILVRPAEDRDVDAAARLARDAYQHYTARIGRRPAPMTSDYAVVISGGTMWVAEDDSRMLGFVVLIDTDDHLLLENVAVDPAAQRKGVGALLLAHAEKEARHRGHARIRLYTHEAMTENLDYYPRKGYVETHRAQQGGYRRVFFVKELGTGRQTC